MPTEEWCLPSGSARVRSQGTTVPDLQDSLPGVQGGDQELRHSVLWERRRPWHPTPVLLPGKSHGRRSLVRCSPWGRKESDRTERLHFHFLLSCIGEGNGNPLQCSCLENPRNGEAWWAAGYGVTQSQTRLKRLSSSSSAPGQLSEQAFRQLDICRREFYEAKLLHLPIF